MKPRIAITIGDPAGIGPEIALKAALDRRVRRACDPIMVGPREIWEEFAVLFRMDIKKLFFHDIYCPRFDIRPGRESAQTGRIAAESIVAAAVMAMDNAVSAITTAPISKLALRQAGYKQSGHTELLAELAGVEGCSMMFSAGGVRVILATIHEKLSSVPRLITVDNLLEKLRLIDKTLKEKWRIKKPRIVVLGLNPHAGEKGIIGREEIKIISPAAMQAVKLGIDVIGPVSAEAGLRMCLEGRADAMLAMYHDQGLLPLKVLGGATNITLGLPFIRTSPDHGTAMDIAWKNKADPEPMVRAVLLAAKLAGVSRKKSLV